MGIKFLLILILTINLVHCKIFENYATEVEGIIDACCQVGLKQFSELSLNRKPFKSCSNFAPSTLNMNLLKIPINLQDLCQETINYCCENKFYDLECEQGKRSAKTKRSCQEFDKSETFQRCCLACYFGQTIALAGGKCVNVSISKLDETTKDCCESYDLLDFDPLDKNGSSEDNDTNEYLDELEECEAGHKCDQRCFIKGQESYCACDDGYILSSDGHTCLKNDTCDQGFMKNDRGVCEDVDECLSGEKVCKPTERCINIPGSYLCEIDPEICPDGYEFSLVSYKCEDINECILSNRCSILENCVNSRGSYSCKLKTCKPGYQLNQKGVCEDIDECLVKTCGGYLKCVNFPGSYSCECEYGFRKDPKDSRICRDINECEEHPGLCSQNCQNTRGSYICSCHFGYRMGSDNKTCVDVNECEAKNGHDLCFGSGKCENTKGSYRCFCPKGLRLQNENYCADIDECKENVCKESETCLNLRGSYKCIEKKRKCQHGYRRSSSNGYCILHNQMLCYDGSNEIEGRCNVPRSYGFLNGSVTANCTVPKSGRGLFIINTKHSFTAEIKGFRVDHAGNNVELADRSFFGLKQTPQGLIVQLLRPIDGPQDIEIELWLFYHFGRFPDHIKAYKISVFVSKYSF